MSIHDVADLYDHATHLPNGQARVAALEAVRDRADAEAPDSLLPFQAREKLIYSYITAGERARSFVPFSWCLAAFDADPARFGHFHEVLLWAFKWQPEGLVKFPEVPMDRTFAVLDDMERRYRSGGHSMHAVLQSKLLVARHLGQVEEAAELWRQWEITPRDGLSDCSGCVPSAQVAYLVEAGRHEDAVRVAEPVLRGALTCAEQPQGILTHLLPAYVAAGRLDQAADAHRRAYQALRSQRSELDQIGRHVEFLARTGNAMNALAVVEAHLPWLEAPESPAAAMTFAAFAALTLGSVEGDTVVRAPGRPVATALAADLAARARAIAARFDARNGSTVVSERVEGWLAAEPWVDELPLSAVARRRQELRRRTAAAAVPDAAAVVSVPVPEGASGDVLLDHLDGRLKAGDEEGAVEAIALLQAADGVLTTFQAARLLDGQARLRAATDLEEAAEMWRESLPGLADDPVLSRRARARLGHALAATGDAEEAVLVGEEPLRWLVENDAEDRRAGWAGSLAQLLLVSDRGAEAVPFTRRALDIDPGKPDLLRLHAEGLWAAGQLEEAASAFVAAVEAASPYGAAPEAMLRWRLSGVLRDAGDSDGEIEQLVEAVALLSSVSQPTDGAAFDLAWAYLRGGQTGEAAGLAEDVARRLGDPDVGVEYLLACCYEALGESERALAHLRAHLGLLDDGGQQAGYRGNLLRREGGLLSSLGRHADAVAALQAADAHFDEAGDPGNRVATLRRAAREATSAGMSDVAVTLRAQAVAIVPELSGGQLAFHLGGLAWDAAAEAADSGRHREAIEHLRTAEGHYRDLGILEHLADCAIFRSELGDQLTRQELEPLFAASEQGSDHWYRLGYALLDVLPEGGAESEALRLRLEVAG